MCRTFRRDGNVAERGPGKGDQMSFDRHLAEIARENPHWTIWRSDAGRWWATRHHPLSVGQREAGCAMTIDADDPDGLREQLQDQERRENPEEPREQGPSGLEDAPADLPDHERGPDEHGQAGPDP